MRKKRLAILLLSFIAAAGCAIGLAACGGNDGGDQGGNGGDQGGNEPQEHVHNLTHHEAVAATCTQSGTIEYWVCSECGKYFGDGTGTTEITGITVAALGHDWGDWTVTTAATCTTVGEETRVCSHDSNHKETREIAIDANNHDWGEWTVTTAATCTTVGEETRICSRDSNHTDTREVAKLPHTYEDGVCTKCGALEPTEGLEYRAYSTELSYTSYAVTGIGTATDTDIVIADEYKGVPVTSIESLAFAYNTSLTSITIPDSVTSIGQNAFYGCSSLENITLGNKVTNIENGAFFGTSLKSITIPDSVSSIGQIAFSNCSSLESVTIGDGVTSIGEGAFYYCISLEKITVDQNNTTYASQDGILYDKSKTHFISIPKAIKECIIPDGIEAIYRHAFEGCSLLESITIPDSVISIDVEAFYGCTSLTSIYYTGDIASWCGISGLGNLMSSSRTLYIDNQELTGNITIPNGVSIIPAYAFVFCNKITNVTIPDSVEAIGEVAFSGCSLLENVTLGNKVTNIENGAFFGCTSLESIAIPDSVTSIGYDAFSGCSLLENVTLGNKVTNIENGAFFGCTSLTNITIPDSVTSIGQNAFYGCSSLENVTLGNKVTNIDFNTFYECTSLKSIIIPDGVSSIGSSAFDGCTSLESITIPDSVTSIGSHAFFGCSLLKNVMLSNQVTSIENFTFYECTSLSSITIPDGIKEVGYNAFYGCTSLANVYYTGTADDWSGITIDSTNSYLTNATKYYYLEKKPIINGIYWHYSDGVATIWDGITYDNELIDGKTFIFSSCEITVSDEFWEIVELAKEYGEVNNLGDAKMIAAINQSNTKEELELALIEYYAEKQSGQYIKFEDGKIYITIDFDLNVKDATDYVVVDGIVYTYPDGFALMEVPEGNSFKVVLAGFVNNGVTMITIVSELVCEA